MCWGWELWWVDGDAGEGQSREGAAGAPGRLSDQPAGHHHGAGRAAAVAAGGGGAVGVQAGGHERGGRDRGHASLHGAARLGTENTPLGSAFVTTRVVAGWALALLHRRADDSHTCMHACMAEAVMSPHVPHHREPAPARLGCMETLDEARVDGCLQTGFPP